MKFKWDGLAIAFVGLLVLVLLVNVLFLAFRPTLVANAYNSAQPFNFTDSSGSQHTVTPPVTVSYTDVANTYGIGIMIFNILAAVVLLLLLVVEVTRLIKHEG